MTRKERDLLKKAICHLMSDKHEWDDGMKILVKLAEPGSLTPLEHLASSPSYRTVECWEAFKEARETIGD